MTKEYVVKFGSETAVEVITPTLGDLRYLKLDCSNSPLTGTLTSQSILPSVDSIYDLGSSSYYWGNTYLNGIYFQNGAAFEQTADPFPIGIQITTGTLFITADVSQEGSFYPRDDSSFNFGATDKFWLSAYIDKIYLGSENTYFDYSAVNTITVNTPATNGSGEVFNMKANNWAVRNRFLSYGGTGAGAPAYSQMQWSCNVSAYTTPILNPHDVGTLPAMQLILGLGSGYDNGGYIISYRAATAGNSHYHELMRLTYTGCTIDGFVSDSSSDAPTATARLDVYTRVASKPALNLRAFTSQSADMLRIYDASSTTGTAYGTKISALGSIGAGLSTKTPTARLESLCDGADYLTAEKSISQINWGNNTWAGFFQRTAGTLHPAYFSEVSSYVALERARGTVTSPTAISSGDRIGALIWGSYLNAAWNRQTSRIYCEATENWVYSNPNYSMGAKICFTTTPNGPTASANKDVVRLTIHHDGTIEQSASYFYHALGTNSNRFIFNNGGPSYFMGISCEYDANNSYLNFGYTGDTTTLITKALSIVDNGTVDLKGAFETSDILTKTAAYTAKITDCVIILNKSTADTLTLPAATASGQHLFIRNKGAGTWTIDGNASETINEETTQLLYQGEAIHLIDDASGNWGVN